jgi:hypothetical protein
MIFMGRLYKGLNAIDVDTKNYVRISEDREVCIGEEITLANGKKYIVESFNGFGFAMVKKIS